MFNSLETKKIHRVDIIFILSYLKNLVVPLNDKFVIDQESLIKKSEGDIHEFYKFENRLGEGLIIFYFLRKT